MPRQEVEIAVTNMLIIVITLFKFLLDIGQFIVERFPWSICDGCGMPAGSAYPSGHLVPSPILGLANAPIVETKFLELAMSLLDFSPRIPLGTFSILLITLFKFLLDIGQFIVAIVMFRRVKFQ